MTDHDWKATIPSATRDKILKGRVPRLVHDERPPYAPGDRIILEYGKVADTGIGDTVAYPERWLTITRVKAEGTDRWISDYSPPAPRPDYLRRGGGYTTDPFLSADPQVEAEHIEVTPEARAKNTIYAERRRLEDNLRGHLTRYHRGSTKTRLILRPVIVSLRAKLDQLEERDAA